MESIELVASFITAYMLLTLIRQKRRADEDTPDPKMAQRQYKIAAGLFGAAFVIIPLVFILGSEPVIRYLRNAIRYVWLLSVLAWLVVHVAGKIRGTA